MKEKQVLDILLVDDSENDIMIIKDAFEQAKILNIVDVVNDGNQALDYLYKRGDFQEAKTPGLVLLDINMPKKNGFEVLEDLKSDDKLKSIPIVMLTTSTRDEDIVKSYSYGACSYVTKPVQFQELQKIVQQFSIYWALVTEVPSWLD